MGQTRNALLNPAAHARVAVIYTYKTWNWEEGGGRRGEGGGGRGGGGEGA